MAYQTKDEDGKLNNFAVEPTMYKVEPQADDAKKTNMMLSLVGGFLVVALIGVTFLVSGGA